VGAPGPRFRAVGAAASLHRMTDETEAAPPGPQHEDTDVDNYDQIQAEVDKHFEGNWERFLKAVENPAEILHFVLKQHFGLDQQKFEKWAQEKQFPPGWVARFYSTLTPDGELKR
jgi:hypothetical protein